MYGQEEGRIAYFRPQFKVLTLVSSTRLQYLPMWVRGFGFRGMG